MNNYWEHRDEINRLFNAPQHRPLKYTAFAVIVLCIAAQIALIIWNDDISEHAKLFTQGCIGVGAVVFVILAGIWTYRVFADYFHQQYGNPRHNR